jgi:glycogen(starch) synthase
VGNMYPPHHAGGYELMWQAAMRETRARGHEVRVLTSDYRGQASPLGREDEDVHRVLRWYWDLQRYEFPHLRPAERVALERHNSAQLRRQLRDFVPDLVWWWSMGCMSLSLIEQVRRAGLPAQFVVHDDWLVYGAEHDQWLRMWRGRRRLLAPAAERVLGIPTQVQWAQAGSFVFNSRYTRDRAGGVVKGEAAVVYPGIDVHALVPAPPQPWRFRLAYVGRIDRQKGIDTAVRALAHLPPEASLTVWGTGDDAYAAEMRCLADACGVGDSVRFAGWAGAKERRQAYADADAVVFPVRWEEPFGLVPLEAMHMGRPVLSTARGGTAEYLRDGENALVFAADDDAGLAACVSRLAGDQELRGRLCEAGHDTAAAFTLENFASRTVTEMERAAATRA